ncbi:hypothetical protein AAFF_G00090160 [Aldrovandia affinis]|uniref:DUF5641 domain-containing protein n=1 Tax=Aldrovandia affinis TaxID=143900 RepID=A0AAD7RYJ2_9TELE|nr:hypothetical protein AAFF_G00090160 [Aldrovandia affinis]
MKEQAINDDCIQTTMCEVKSIINGRPLTTISDDMNDLEPLTPNHLLLLKSQPNMPPGIFNKDDIGQHFPTQLLAPGKSSRTLPDSSGVVRRVKIKTKTNVLERPVNKLCLLEEAAA